MGDKKENNGKGKKQQTRVRAFPAKVKQGRHGPLYLALTGGRSPKCVRTFDSIFYRQG